MNINFIWTALPRPKIVCKYFNLIQVVIIKENQSKSKIVAEPDIPSRNLESDPLDVRKLVDELKIGEKSSKYSNDDDSEDETKPVVIKAVKVWKARKKEEEKLKKRYQTLLQNYARGRNTSTIQSSSSRTAAKLNKLSK